MPWCVPHAHDIEYITSDHFLQPLALPHSALESMVKPKKRYHEDLSCRR